MTRVAKEEAAPRVRIKNINDLPEVTHVIVSKLPDGRVYITSPSREALSREKLVDIARRVAPRPPKPDGMTDEEYLKVKQYPYRIAPLSAIPQDRTYREAWTDDLPTDTVDVHMDKAREIHMARIRQVRNKKLSELDVAAARALEDVILSDDKTAAKEIVKKKKILRDLPTTVDLSKAETPDQLKAIIPDILKE